MYEGTVNKDMKPDGFGTLVLDTGDIYVGDIKNGVLEGKGRLEDKNGNWYEGEFKNGMKNGKGKEKVLKRISKKVALFNVIKRVIKRNKERRTNGKTAQVLASNCAAIYEGNFKNDKRNGYGKLKNSIHFSSKKLPDKTKINF